MNQHLLLGFGVSQPFLSFRVSSSPCQVGHLSIAVFFASFGSTKHHFFRVWGFPTIPFV